MDEFAKTFGAQGDAESARFQKAYLKSSWEFHGVNVPCMRSAARSFHRRQPNMAVSDLRALVDEAWASPYHDLRSVSFELLVLYRRRLSKDDVPWLEAILRQCRGWDHVDHLCTKVLGPLLDAGHLSRSRVTSWATDGSFWVRRASLLVQLSSLRQGAGDFEWFSSLAVPMLPEKEFFIRKAIGWVLREVSKKRPALVGDFVAAHLDTMSGVTFREAVKYLPAPQRDSLKAHWSGASS